MVAGSEQHSEEQQDGLFVTSRRTLIEQRGTDGTSDAEHDQLATVLTQLVDRLGG